MLTPGTLFEAEIRKRIEAEIAQRTTDLAGGNALDFAAYRYNVGFIAGLEQALGLCDDAETQVSKQ